MKLNIKLHEMEGDFASMPRAVFISERVKKKYWGQDEMPEEKPKEESK